MAGVRAQHCAPDDGDCAAGHPAGAADGAHYHHAARTVSEGRAHDGDVRGVWAGHLCVRRLRAVHRDLADQDHGFADGPCLLRDVRRSAGSRCLILHARTRAR
ncbi:hypothetical protein G6F59_017050 [Rhizopus arrhizus]|nr:hypothetical protein G6F59_017050 [Rhizopus arrhizus]